MSRDLQGFGWKESAYERPNQKWICGRSLSGEPCPTGPDARGRCRSTYECSPTRKGDRWSCERPGGACEVGPQPDGRCSRPVSPCQPLPSLRARRGAVVGGVMALTFGVLLVLSFSPSREALISPGELSSPHGTLSRKCASCHNAARDGWVHTAVNGSGELGTSGRCLECHSGGAHGVDPHGVPAEVLARFTEAAKAGKRGGAVPLLLSMGGREPGRVACASCHPEHRGHDAAITEVDDTRCQACHVRKFRSFAEGHPEFSSYPYRRRTRIAFDHDHHAAQFAAEKRAFDCLACHVPGERRESMGLRGFETACASCHGKEFLPLRVFGIPPFDVALLAKEKVPVGEWPVPEPGGAVTPEDTLGGLLGPFVRREPGLSKDALDTYTGLFVDSVRDLSDLEGEKGDLAAVAEVAWSVKRFLNGVTSDPAWLKPKLEAMIGAKLTDDAFARLSVEPLQSALADIVKRSLPGLAEEVKAHGEKKSPPAKPLKVEVGPFEPRPGPWIRDAHERALTFGNPHADPFTVSLVTLMVERAGDEAFARLTGAGGFLDRKAPSGPGLCLKCHGIDRDTGGMRRIRWRMRDRATRASSAAFSHDPHLPAIPDASTCFGCHAPRSGKVRTYDHFFREGVVQPDPGSFAPDFAAMAKADCARCHSANRAPDRCTACHDYHFRGTAESLLRMPELRAHPVGTEKRPSRTDEEIRAILLDDGAKGGDPGRGSFVFFQLAACGTCHVEGKGGAAPDLKASLKGRDVAFIVESILDPGAVVDDTYQASLVRTRDGRVLRGVVVGASNEGITLSTESGEVSLSRGEIVDQRVLEGSRMPRGLVNHLSPEELKDLLAYLLVR